MEDRLMRADAALAARGLAGSREKARVLIELGLATVNGTVIKKPAQKVSGSDALAVLGEAHPYVSRGGLKLEKALRVFGVDATGRVCMDIGASTGGFTDVLLQSGARKVYAIDVGTGQLDEKLRRDPRVVCMERVNARALEAAMFDEAPTLAVMDVSFISIRLILPAALAILGDQGHMVTLIKPQFEAGRAAIGKGGIVTSAKAHRDVLAALTGFAPTLGWRVRALDVSPITGGDGNVEFLADLVPDDGATVSVTEAEIERLVREAHGKGAQRSSESRDLQETDPGKGAAESVRE